MANADLTRANIKPQSMFRKIIFKSVKVTSQIFKLPSFNGRVHKFENGNDTVVTVKLTCNLWRLPMSRRITVTIVSVCKYNFYVNQGRTTKFQISMI